MVVAAKAKWLKTTIELQTCLGVKFKSCFNCQGRSATKSSCGNAVSQASRSEMPFVMLDIINCGNLASASVHLERLASLALCKRSHQSQAVEMATQWKVRIRSYLEVCNDGGVVEEMDVKAPVRPQRTTMITPSSTPVANKRDFQQPVSTRSSQRTAAPPPPVTPRRATRAPRGSASSTTVLIEEDFGDYSEKNNSDGEDSEEDSEEQEKYLEPEPAHSQTSRARAPAPSVKWEPNGKAGLPYPYLSQTEVRKNLEYKLAKAQAELAMYEAWARLRKFE